MLWLAEISPELVINTAKAVPTRNKEVVLLLAEVQNIGYLPTNITQRSIEAKLYRGVRAHLSLNNAELIGGTHRYDLGHISGKRDSDQASSNSKRHLQYVVRIKGADASATLTISSDKAGIVKKVVKLN